MDKKTGKEKARCHISGTEHDIDQLIIGDDVSASLMEEIRKDYSDFDDNSLISTKELFRYRQRQMENIIKKEVGEMTELETQVLERLRSNKFISDNVEPDIESESTIGEKLSDKIAEFGGSWKFIIFFLSFMGCWMAVNVALYHNNGYDPYPFILLNLVLSCLAALQAPIIMMSQNRQNDKDRQRSEHDYQVNLAAELQIRLLHDKIDHMMLNQHKQIVEIQEIQIELMHELEEKMDKLK